MLLHLKLRSCSLLAERRLNRYLRKADIDALALGVLIAASEHPRSEIDIATLLDVHPNSLVQICRRLEQKALIQRQRDPNDKRKWLILPTPAAKTLVRKAKKITRLVFYPLTPEQIHQLDALITKILDAVQLPELWL